MEHSLAVAVTRDGCIVAGAEDGSVCAWDTEGQRVLTRFHAHDGPVRCLVLTETDDEVISSKRHGNSCLSFGDG